MIFSDPCVFSSSAKREVSAPTVIHHPFGTGFWGHPYIGLLRPGSVHQIGVKNRLYRTPLKGNYFWLKTASFYHPANNHGLFSRGGHRAPFMLSTAYGGCKTGPDSGFFWRGTMYRETLVGAVSQGTGHKSAGGCPIKHSLIVPAFE
jgi:hypothetical protein